MDSNGSIFSFSQAPKTNISSIFLVAVGVVFVLSLSICITLIILFVIGNIAEKSPLNKTTTTRNFIQDTLPPQIFCGIQKVKPSIDLDNLNSVNGRIIGGNVATRGSWPWKISLKMLNKNKIGNHFCGGTLIYSQYVITAAHCVYNRNRLSFIAELEDAKSLYYLSDLIFHPEFNPTDLANDIAVLKLNRPVYHSEKICLPGSNFTQVFEKDLVLVGRGSSTGKRSFPSKNLLQTVLRVKNSDSFCTSNLTYCALSSDGSSNACFGDSGSPLMYFTNERWYLYGLTSFIFSSSGQCLSYFPSFFTAIPSYLDWIGSAIATMSQNEDFKL